MNPFGQDHRTVEASGKSNNYEGFAVQYFTLTALPSVFSVVEGALACQLQSLSDVRPMSVESNRSRKLTLELRVRNRPIVYNFPVRIRKSDTS